MKMNRYLLVLSMLLQQVFAQSWLPLGSNEQTLEPISVTAAFVTYSATAADGTVYVSYIDDIPGPNSVGDFKVHVRKYDNGQWVDLGAASSQFPATDFFPIACDGTDLYLAYNEPINDPANAIKVTVKKYNAAGNNWLTVGQAGLSAGGAAAIGIVAANGRVYVAYGDEKINGKLTVKMYNNASPALGWQQVGAPIISAGPVAVFLNTPINMAIDDDKLYVAYVDGSLNLNNGGLMVKKFINNIWITVGGAIVSGPEIGLQAKMAFTNNHDLYVAYHSSPSGVPVLRALVSPINVWGDFGNAPPDNNIAGGMGLAAINQRLYVAYSKAAGNGAAQAIVKQFNPNTSMWEALGNNPVTTNPTSVTNLSLQADWQGRLNLVFHDFSGGIYAKSYETGIPMPLRFLQFTVQAKAQDALLQWETDNEINTRHFEVEHSTDGLLFAKLGQVAAANASQQNSYRFIAKNLVAGIHYFRLRQVDKDGAFAYSATIHLVMNASVSSAVSIYPSPAKETIWLSNPGALYTHATITAMDGRKIKTMVLTANNHIVVSTLAKGQYFITCYNAKGSYTVAFVKE